MFGHVSYDVSDALTISGGLRYTDDDKDFDGRQAAAADRAAERRPTSR